jgi:hypothetical protein
LSLNRPAAFARHEHSDRESIQKTLAKLRDAAFAQRNQLSVYDRLLLALALRGHPAGDRAATVMKGILDTVEIDNERGTAHVPVAARQYWFAWNSEIETNAWLLRALVAVEPENPLTAKVANWLVSSRKNGRFWRSTKDTALSVTAIAEYLAAAGAEAGEQTVDLRLDKGPATTVRIARGDILGSDTVLDLPAGNPLAPGRHEIAVERSGSGTLHFAMHAEFLRTRGLGEAQGNGISITRKYFKLASLSDGAGAAVEDQTARSLESDVKRDRRRLLSMDDTLSSGDVIEVELAIQSDEDYEYVAFEDMKPAGCEPIQLQSGHAHGTSLWANVELRDDRVVFFAGYLPKGMHVLRYKLRAETPGRFHALPARGFAMYAPEIYAQSDEVRLSVRE